MKLVFIFGSRERLVSEMTRRVVSAMVNSEHLPLFRFRSFSL